MMTEIAITIYLFIGFIAAVIYFAVKINSEDIPAEQTFKKIYQKRKNDLHFYLCDYCTKCKMKYTYTEHTCDFPFEKTVTKRTVSEDCPFEGENITSIKVCSKFILDSNKV